MSTHGTDQPFRAFGVHPLVLGPAFAGLNSSGEPESKSSAARVGHTSGRDPLANSAAGIRCAPDGTVLTANGKFKERRLTHAPFVSCPN